MAIAAPMAKALASGQDPRNSAIGQIKLLATLDGAPAYWTYSGIIYAIQDGKHPSAILAASGCQSSWAQEQPDGSYIVTGATLTFFRDIQTGAIIDFFDNPLTGQRNAVMSNFLSGARILFPADGSSARADTLPVNGGAIAPGGYQSPDKQKPLGIMCWHVSPDLVTLTTDRSWSVPAQPQLEAELQTCDRGDFFDASLKRISARGASTTIIPWMRWMQMGSIPGHLVWHTSSEKSFSLDALDMDYRAKAGPLIDRFAEKP